MAEASFQRAGLAAAVVLALLALALACGGEDEKLPDDPRVQTIASVVEDAANDFGEGGTLLFYQWFSPTFHERCSPEEFGLALKETRMPSAFRALKAVDLGDGEANATSELIDDEGKSYREEWALVEGEEGAWYLNDVPATKDCGR